ncbi:MAG: hypothetical protein ACJAT2_003676 [Bacteriovoracaceae bacterium]|jgi:hypothetical protein
MRAYLITLLLIFTSTKVFAISGDDFVWKIANKRNGITVFKAEEHESGLVPIKVETILPFPPSRVLSVIADTSRKQEWVPDLMIVETVKKIDEYDKIEYSVYDSPWPFSDRSFLVHIKSIAYVKEKKLVIKLNSIELPEIPKKKEYVRGFTYNGDVILKNDGKGNSYFQVLFLTDFKGNIPKWIVNMVQLGWPKKMIKGLTKQIKRDDIQIQEKFKFLD